MSRRIHSQELIAELAAQGKTRVEIAQAIGSTYTPIEDFVRGGGYVRRIPAQTACRGFVMTNAPRIHAVMVVGIDFYPRDTGADSLGSHGSKF